jgi:hypothetical protein
MATDKQFYTDKLNKLQQKANGNLQRLIATAFEVVAEAQDINERITEIQNLLKAEELEKKEVKPLPKK